VTKALAEHIQSLFFKGTIAVLGRDSASEIEFAASIREHGIEVTLGHQAVLGNTSIVIIDLGEGAVEITPLRHFLGTGERPLILLTDATGSGEANNDLLERVLIASGYMFPPIEIAESGIFKLEHPERPYKNYFDVAGYWEARYDSGRDSGRGSYRRLAKFKADFINDFISHNQVASVIDFGCGDGNQATLFDFPRYIGLDISATAIEKCRAIFADDPSKEFHIYDPGKFKPRNHRCELSLSLDVIYHLSDDQVYRHYIDHLFGASDRYVIIYANSETFSPVGVNESAAYIRFRDFIRDIEERFPGWTLIHACPNRYPYSALDPSNTSFADFYVFSSDKKKSEIEDSDRIIETFERRKALRMLSIQNESALQISDQVKRVSGDIDRSSKLISELSRKLNATEAKRESDRRTEQLQELHNALDILKDGMSSISEKVQAGSRVLAKNNFTEILDSISELSEPVRELRKQVEAIGAEQADRTTHSDSLIQRLVDKVGALERQQKQWLENQSSDKHEERLAKAQQKFESAVERRLSALQAFTQKPARAAGDQIPLIRQGNKAVDEVEQLLREAGREYRAILHRKNAVENSVSFRAGKAFADALAKPGVNTLRLPIRLIKSLRHGVESDTRYISDLETIEAARRQLASVRNLLEQPLEGSGVATAARPWYEDLELSETPIWFHLEIAAGSAVNIQSALKVEDGPVENGKSVIALVECLNSSGRPLKENPGGLAYSSRFEMYFKYIRPSETSETLHAFIPPAGTSHLLIGVRTFHPRRARKYLLSQISIDCGTGRYARMISHEEAAELKQPAPETAAFTPPSKEASELSILGWPEHPPNGRPYVIGIMDEFTAGCFERDMNLIQPRPDNWYALAEKYKPEMFFIESAWKGNYGSWQYRVGDYANKPGQEVAHICHYARERGIPTVFWNKEDPVHHQKFMCSAKLVDHIFTTDANMQASYQAKTGNPNVHALPFAAQPALHKPAPLAGRKPRACFAGSWYGNRHAERGEAMRWLLRAANRHGLDIFDRNHGTGIFPFPEEYQAGIKGSLPYKALCEEYRRYRVFLNVNSVMDSPTMFARRVFELMACGTPVVSTYAKGIENLFESDAVWMVNSEAEAGEAVHTLMTDDAEWRRRSLAGIREVFARHTYAHRLNEIFDRLGIDTHLPTDPAIALVAAADNQAELEALNRFAIKQGYRHFRLGVACAEELTQSADSLSDKITLLQRGQKAPWLAAQHSESPLAGWLSPQHRYGEHYLRDLVNASLYEPGACGWAKALDHDQFAYAGEACLSGSLWSTPEFLKNPIKAHSGERITRPNLYLADSDQFQPAGAVQ